jgi:lycopene cyclase domain-containing protein
MFHHYIYVSWLLVFLALPIGVLAIAARRALWERRWALLLTLGVALSGGWVWDKLAINLGAWVFDPNNILNRWIGGLPVEEWCWIAGTTLLFGGATVVLANRFEAAHGREVTRAAAALGPDGVDPSVSKTA